MNGHIDIWLSVCVHGVCETNLKFATTFLLQIQSFDISSVHTWLDELFKFYQYITLTLDLFLKINWELFSYNFTLNCICSGA